MGNKKCIPVIAAILIAFGLQFAYNYAYYFVGGIPFEWNRNNGTILMYRKT